MKKTIEDFENNARPEWNREANWAKIESSIKAPGKFRKTPWLLLLLGLTVFGTGYALSYYVHQAKNKHSVPVETKIQPDTIQVIAEFRDTVEQYRKQFIYQRDTVFIVKEMALNLVPESPEKNENVGIAELPELHIPPNTIFTLPDFKSIRTGKRTSKPYATNVFFDDTTSVTRTEFRIFHRIEGKEWDMILEELIVLIK
ncbi:MAG: hypothetical protein IPI60_10545 [Saprospiraceae bacterium]|nr:hypothetical protein [Saprospiraceae bacterium]